MGNVFHELGGDVHFYKFNIGDYASHTRHLTPLEDIAYRRMLDLAYITEQPLVKDIRQLSRLINLRDYQQEIADVLSEFWTEVDEGWVHGRVLKEIEDAGEKSSKAKEAVCIRWARVKAARVLREEYERNTNVSNDEYERIVKQQNMDTTSPEIHTTQDYKTTRLQDTLHKTQDKPSEVISITDNNNTCMSSHPVPTKKKATPLPENWVLPKTWGEWAMQEKPMLTVDDVRKMADCFKDHWIANASRAASKKSDWFATWRNWVRRSAANKATVPRTEKTYHQVLQDTRNQIFGEINHGTKHKIIDITPRETDRGDSENF